MNRRSSARPKVTLVALSLLFATLCCLVGVAIIRQKRQIAPRLTYTQLSMPHGRDIRRAFVGSEEMNDICVKRLLQENKDCAKLGITGEERHKRLFAVHDAGEAEINRVIASHYKEVFDPSVMDKAVRDVEESR